MGNNRSGLRLVPDNSRLVGVRRIVDTSERFAVQMSFGPDSSAADGLALDVFVSTARVPVGARVFRCYHVIDTTFADGVSDLAEMEINLVDSAEATVTVLRAATTVAAVGDIFDENSGTVVDNTYDDTLLSDATSAESWIAVTLTDVVLTEGDMTVVVEYVL